MNEYLENLAGGLKGCRAEIAIPILVDWMRDLQNEVDALKEKLEQEQNIRKRQMFGGDIPQ